MPDGPRLSRYFKMAQPTAIHQLQCHACRGGETGLGSFAQRPESGREFRTGRRALDLIERAIRRAGEKTRERNVALHDNAIGGCNELRRGRAVEGAAEHIKPWLALPNPKRPNTKRSHCYDDDKREADQRNCRHPASKSGRAGETTRKRGCYGNAGDRRQTAQQRH